MTDSLDQDVMVQQTVPPPPPITGPAVGLRRPVVVTYIAIMLLVKALYTLAVGMSFVASIWDRLPFNSYLMLYAIRYVSIPFDIAAGLLLFQQARWARRVAIVALVGAMLFDLLAMYAWLLPITGSMSQWAQFADSSTRFGLAVGGLVLQTAGIVLSNMVGIIALLRAERLEAQR